LPHRQPKCWDRPSDGELLVKPRGLFRLAEFATEAGRVFHDNHRVGGGLTVGAMADITDQWKFAVSGSYINFPLGDKSEEWRLAAQQRYTLKRNFALRFDFNQRARTQELLFNLLAFF
jgi:hypothetical protein